MPIALSGVGSDRYATAQSCLNVLTTDCLLDRVESKARVIVLKENLLRYGQLESVSRSNASSTLSIESLTYLRHFRYGDVARFHKSCSLRNLSDGIINEWVENTLDAVLKPVFTSA